MTLDPGLLRSAMRGGGLLLLQCGLALGTLAARSDPPAPRLLWTAERQRTWQRMVFENHPDARVVRENCDRAGRGAPRYGDRGLWCTIWYRWSGDPTAARIAWSQLGPLLTAAPANANEVREQFIDHAIMFDWLRPALSDQDVGRAVEGLNGWARYALAIGTPQWVGGIRTSDTDALVGYYFGLALADLATRGLPGHVAWLRAVQERPSRLPVGGLTPDTTFTARRAIRDLLTGPARGGVWVESSEYNLGTLTLLALGVEGVRTALDRDPFPEADRFFREVAEAQLMEVTPDLRQALQWGDTEHPRGFNERLFRRRTLLGVLAGVLAGTDEGARITDLSRALAARHGTAGYLSAEPWARFYLLHDPWAQARSWREGPDEWYAEGMGMAWVRRDEDLFWMAMHPWLGVDHEVQYLGDFQLYRRGEWVLTRPLGYAGPAVEAESANTLILSGLGGMSARGPVRYDEGQGWWALTGETKGPLYRGRYWDPPPPFVDRWRRTVVYLPRAGTDHLVVVDWVEMQDPRNLPRLERYRAVDQQRIAGRLGLIEWVLHAASPPRYSPDAWHWSTPGGQSVTVTTLSPVQEEAKVIPEAELWRGTQHFRQSEMRWQLRLIPGFQGGGITLRHVISVGADRPKIALDEDTIVIGRSRIRVTPSTVQVEG